MRLLVFSDLHAHTHQAYAKPTAVGGNTRLDNSIRVLSFLREKAEETGIKDIICSGDLFEAKGRVPIVVLNAVYRELNLWRNAGLNLVLIPGNHDFAVRSGEEHALEVLQEFGMISLISSPSWVYWKTSSGEEVGLTVVPFRDNLKKDWFHVMPNGSSITDNSLRICVAHGVVQGSRFSLTNEKSLSDYTQEATIPLSWLEGFDLSIVGHVHLPQVMEGAEKVLIPGQPWQQFPHEHDQLRGIWEVHIERGGVPSYHLHPVSGVPRFVSVQLSKGGSYSWDKAEGSELKDAVSGNIILMSTESALVPSEIINAAQSTLLSLGAVFIDVRPFQGDPKEQGPRVVIDVKDSAHDTLKKAVESGHVLLRGHSEESILSLGEAVLEEVLADL